jgi:PAS domain S-box-containing protein
MPNQSQRASPLFFKAFAKAAALLAVLIGGLVLIGWALGIEALESILPGLATMKGNTALSFVLLGCSLWIRSAGTTGSRARRLGQAGAGIAAAVGLLTLGEYATGRHFGIDQFLFNDPASAALGAFPGRMPPASALNILLLGLGLALPDERGGHSFREAAAVTTFTVSILALIGYAYGISALYQIGAFSSMALHTALTCAALSLGVLFVGTEGGLMSLIGSGGAGGVLARRLLPAALGIPFVLGWLALAGDRRGLYDTPVDTALLVLTNILIFAGLILWNAELLERKGLAQYQAEERFRLVVESAPNAMVMVDQRGGIVLVNAQAEKLFGYSRAELLGKSVERLVPFRFRGSHPGFRTAFHSEPHARPMGAGPDLYGLRKDGSEVPIEIGLNPIRSEEGLLVLSSIVDITERRQTQTALQLSEHRFRALTENSWDAVALFGSDGTILYGSPSTPLILGYSLDEFVGRNAFELIHPDDHALVTERLKAALAKPREHVNVHARLRHKNGKWRWMEGVFTNLLDEPGVEAIVNNYHDFTERKQAEDALRQSEQLFSKAFYESPIGITITKMADGIYTDANDAFLKMSGFQREELLGHTAAELHITPDSGSDGLVPAKLEQDAGFRNVAHAINTKAGELRHVLVSGQSIQLGGIQYILGLTEDITDQKRAESALQAANERLERQVLERTAALSEANALMQTLMDNMPDHIYFKDRAGRFIRNSRSQAMLMGLSDPSSVTGKTDFDFFPPEHAQRSYAEEQRVMSTGEPLVNLEERVVWPDGRLTWVSTTKLPLRERDGQVIGTFGISRDITGRKQAEQALQISNAKLESANKELEAFAYSVSHDLRAPLRAIDGFSGILLEECGGQLPAEALRHLNIIRTNTQQMGMLIDDLLAFSRLSRQPLKLQEFAPVPLVQQVLEDLRADYGSRQVEISVGDIPNCLADPALLKQVFVNLIANALKYTRQRPVAKIEIGARQNPQAGSGPVYFVRDNGVGFDMEYYHKLFGVFQRLHRADEYEGTGVGLAIVQRIVNRHGGRVWAEAELDGGATFFFTLQKEAE